MDVVVKINIVAAAKAQFGLKSSCLFYEVERVIHYRHKLSRHQYYLQLRKDFLEDRLSCHEESSLCLAGLALQAEYGDCMPEVPGPGTRLSSLLLSFYCLFCLLYLYQMYLLIQHQEIV